jgi:hypothetical protein
MILGYRVTIQIFKRFETHWVIKVGTLYLKSIDCNNYELHNNRFLNLKLFVAFGP